MGCTIRTMRDDEVDLAIEWAAREGWNPGLHDAKCFHAADPEGFLMAERDSEPLGCISAVSYAGRFGFIGLFIVAPAWRGQGVGSQLWAQATARLVGHVIGLDGVPAQQDYYRRSGFRLAWSNVRFAGVVARCDKPAAHPQIVPLGAVDFAALCGDDARVFPAPRASFLRCWIAMPEATGLAWVEQGHIAGWGVIRRCREGHKIGPLNADRPQVASALYEALCSAVPAGDAVYLDVPMHSASAVALAKANRLRSVFETARMYAGPAPACELERVYGITTFELG
jgi:GNAT superfamily N-acetyltransferase